MHERRPPVRPHPQDQAAVARPFGADRRARRRHQQGRVRDRAVLHLLPVGYSLDETKGVRDPRGMLGKEFGIDMHMMSVDLAVTRNLMLAIESCHLEVAAMAASPYAAALSVLADDEADLG